MRVYQGLSSLTTACLDATIAQDYDSSAEYVEKGEGMKTTDCVGDMIITVEIQLPKTLSDDEIKLYEKLKRMSHGNIRDNFIHD